MQAIHADDADGHRSLMARAVAVVLCVVCAEVYVDNHDDDGT